MLSSNIANTSRSREAAKPKAGARTKHGTKYVAAKKTWWCIERCGQPKKGASITVLNKKRSSGTPAASMLCHE
jgi:hypothetical protein